MVILVAEKVVVVAMPKLKPLTPPHHASLLPNELGSTSSNRRLNGVHLFNRTTIFSTTTTPAIPCTTNPDRVLSVHLANLMTEMC